MDAGGPRSGSFNPYAPPAAAIDLAAPQPAEGQGYAFKSTIGLANAIGVLMVLDALLELGAGVNSFVTIGVMNRVAAGEEVDQSVLTAIDTRSQAIAVLVLLLVIATVVLFCLFMPRANRNARSFGSIMSMTPGWAAGWFFIPVALWWKPYYAMKEIWQGSDPDPGVHALQATVSALLPWWWWMWLLRGVGEQVVQQMTKHGKGPSGLIASCQAQLVFMVPSVASALLAAAVVRAVARRQDERQRRQTAGAPAPITAGVAP